MTLEVCCGNLESVHAAVTGGAPRIELCQALEQDGLTPSWDVLQEARKLYPQLVIHVLIRSRAGDFCYSSDEGAEMSSQIEKALELGADGLVLGALTPSGDVDMAAMQAWMGVLDDWMLAKGFEAGGCHSCMDAYFFQGLVKRPSVTFHRAFDHCREPFRALEDIIGLGCNRILTSGQAPTALEGAGLLKELRLKADGRIGILPGGGITPENARAILEATGCTELHASASITKEGRKVTSAALVSALNAILR
jgi:copper homeostasis protein